MFSQCQNPLTSELGLSISYVSVVDTCTCNYGEWVLESAWTVDWLLWVAA